MATHHRIIVDLQKKEEIPDETIHLIVTSPPYSSLGYYFADFNWS